MFTRGAVICMMVAAIGFAACGGDDGGASTPASLLAVDGSGAVLVTASFASTSVGAKSSLIVVVENTGSQPTGILALGATSEFAIDASTTTCGAIALMGGSFCNVGISFTPAAVGARTGTLVVAADPGGSTTVVLDGSGIQSNMGIAPAAIDLPFVDVGTTTQATLTISNTGSGPGTLGAPSTTGAGWVVGATTCGASLIAGASCTIDVGFSPTGLGSASGTLTIDVAGTTDTVPLTALGTSQITVAAAGTGTGTVTSTPTGITCGSACVGHFPDTVQLTAVPVTGSALASWSTAGCTAATCALPASTSARTVTATFVPTTLHVAPTSTPLGTLEIGTHTDTTIDVVNDGGAAIPITLVVAGSDYSQLSTTCTGTLAGNATCQVVVRYSPSALGASPGTLDVQVAGLHHVSGFTATGASRVTVAFAGSGTGTVTSNPGAIDCGTGGSVCSDLFASDVTLTATADANMIFQSWSVAACGANLTCDVPASTSARTVTATFRTATNEIAITGGPGPGATPVLTEADTTYTIANTSAFVVAVDSVGLTVGDNAYGIVSSTCGATLAVGGSCTVDVSFMAITPGEGNDTSIVVVADGVSYSQAISAVGSSTITVTTQEGDGSTGGGTVTDSATPTQTCTDMMCVLTEVANTITLTATPDSGFAFDHWDDDASSCGTTPTCTVTLGAAGVTVLAVFVAM